LLRRIPDAIHGAIAGLTTIAAHPEAKRALHMSTGALAVDNESHVVASAAAARGLPMAAVRVIVDPFTRELPAVVALPLLLGVGVAFKIYCVMAWRAGKTALLQSVLTRAVIFSAMTTATAFGSLWLSNHPGTSSMGKLMALALVCTMAAAVLFHLP
jgi:predicted RND superfamily exporter protein